MYVCTCECTRVSVSTRVSMRVCARVRACVSPPCALGAVVQRLPSLLSPEVGSVSHFADEQPEA